MEYTVQDTEGVASYNKNSFTDVETQVKWLKGHMASTVPLSQILLDVSQYGDTEVQC